MATTIERSPEYKVVGTTPTRTDAIEKVTGKAQYAADIYLAGNLYGKILRSPHAHARIKSIDVSKARTLPGVKAVATHEDFPPIPDAVMARENEALNLRHLRDNVLASEKVLYEGQPVAALAADSPHVAEEALSLIKVEYEVLKPVMTVLEAMQPDAPVLHEKLPSGATMEQTHPNARRLLLQSGDIEQGFREADVIVEREFTTAMVHQGYIEPHATIVDVKRDGRMTVWTTTQSAYSYRDQISKILLIPQSMIKVIPTECGGAFGGKEVARLEPVAAILSRKAGKPVRIAMSRAEDLSATGPAPGCYIKVKIGANKDGRITAADMYFAYEAGAFPGAPVVQAATLGMGRYNVLNQRAEGYDVVVNRPKQNSYRAPGGPQIHFATEQLVDELAEKLGFDPIEFRRVNAAKEGDRNIQGIVYSRLGGEEVLQAMRKHPHYTAPLEGPNRGRGIAIGFKPGGGGVSWCNISVNPDGTLSMLSGSPDMSGTRLTTAMQAAETLGLPVELFSSGVGDSDDGGFATGSWGSRTAVATGAAAHNAALDIIKKMTERAAKIWGIDVEDVSYDEGVFTSRSDESKRSTFKELAEKLNSTGGTIIGQAVLEGVTIPPVAGHIIDVEVDPETGKIDILRCTVVQDVGRAIHPDIVEGQLQGGTIQGIGFALTEEYYYTSEGRLANKSLLDYRMPVALDAPHVETVIVEVPNPRQPYGVKPVGESTMTTPPAAIANAVYKAIGVRLSKLPMSPRNVLEAIWEQKA